jgi:single-strand DNA-binding protein
MSWSVRYTSAKDAIFQYFLIIGVKLKTIKGVMVMNIAILTGHLGADPESKFSQDEMLIVNFSLAFKSTKDKTDWLKIVCFNKTAELAEKYLHKGAKIAVTGMLDQDKWTTDKGETKTLIKLIANSIEFIKTDGRGFESNNNGNQNINQQSNNNTNNNDIDNDIPF